MALTGALIMGCCAPPAPPPPPVVIHDPEQPRPRLPVPRWRSDQALADLELTLADRLLAEAAGLGADGRAALLRDAAAALERACAEATAGEIYVGELEATGFRTD